MLPHPGARPAARETARRGPARRAESGPNSRPHEPGDDARTDALVEDLGVLAARGLVEQVRTLDDFMSGRRSYHTAAAFITSAGRRAVAAASDPAPSLDCQDAPCMADVDEKRKQRYRFLSARCDFDEKAFRSAVEHTELGASLGFTPAEAVAISKYLSDEGLIEAIGFLSDASVVRIAHPGERKVEAARSAPERSTEHFPAYASNVTINVREMHHSQIQAGSHGSSQHLAITDNDLNAVREFVSSVREHMRTAELSAAAESHAKAELATIEAQLGPPSPRRKTIGEAPQELRTTLDGTGLAAAYLPQLRPLLDRFSS